MKQVQFKDKEGRVYNVITEIEDYYILDHHATAWNRLCLVAVPKAAMTVVEEVTYKTGQMFKVGDQFTILAQLGFRLCALIKFEDGNRYAEPIKVGNCKEITQEELSRMSYTLPVLVT